MKVPHNSFYSVGGATLLACVPVLAVARENIASLNWTDFWTVLGAVAGLTGALLTALAFLPARNVGIVASVGVTNWLSAYAPEVNGFLGRWGGVLDVKVTFPTVLLLIFASLLIVFAVLPRRLVASAIGTTGLALFALAAAPLAASQMSKELTSSGMAVPADAIYQPLPESTAARRELPDIVYIVPDRYGSASVLEQYFNHNNNAFLDELRNRAFFIAKRARANYLRTRYSLTSSLNMQYLEAFSSAMDGATTSYEPLYSLIRDNLVVHRLKSMGYQYTHVGNGWDGARHPAQPDNEVNFSLPGAVGGEFGAAIFSRSLIFSTAVTLMSGNFAWSPCAALKAQLTFLETVGGKARPTFTFAHVIAPHSPILTDAEGRCIEPIDYPNEADGITWQGFQQGYSGFVSYLNKRILEIFDAQKEHNPNPLIFVVQSDEGPWPQSLREASAKKTSFDWRRADADELVMKFGIINALYFSDREDMGVSFTLPNDLSPVNNWRIIFGYLENKSYPLLPNRYFIVPPDHGPYHSVEITQRLNALPRR